MTLHIVDGCMEDVVVQLFLKKNRQVVKGVILEVVAKIVKIDDKSTND